MSLLRSARLEKAKCALLPTLVLQAQATMAVKSLEHALMKKNLYRFSIQRINLKDHMGGLHKVQHLGENKFFQNLSLFHLLASQCLYIRTKWQQLVN